MPTTHAHHELLTRANKVRAAATDLDAERLRREVAALLEVFTEHTEAVTASLVGLPSAAIVAVGRAQQRVLKRLVELTRAADAPEVDPRCGELGVELTTLVSLQTDVERRTTASTPRAEVATPSKASSLAE